MNIQIRLNLNSRYPLRHSTYRSRLATLSLSLSLLLSLLFCSNLHASDPSTALDDYINAADPSYSYQLISTTAGTGITTHRYSMISQQWRTTSEVDRNIWSHTLAIIVPDQVLYQTGMVIAGSGNNSGSAEIPSSEILMASQLALVSNSIVAVLGQSLNQPLLFADQSQSFYEDDLVAYSWDKAMESGDYSWPVYLPMVKSLIRAMDTVQAVTPAISGHLLNDFVVSGFSKRGTATWLSAAVDSRIRAISPGVADSLNMTPQLEHHFMAYGFYSSAMQPYLNFDLPRRVRTPEGQALLSVIDPYYYRDRLSLPKFLLNASGDQFFLPDSAQFYLHDLSGESLIRYVPNSDHSLSDPNGINNALISLTNWYTEILADSLRPVISWQISTDSVSVTAVPPPSAATLWQASNPDARDFRKQTIGASWSSSPLSGNGNYQVNIPAPTTGWTAFFVELNYPGSNSNPLTFSTRIFVTPDTRPFELSDPINNPRNVSYWARQIKSATSRLSVAKKLEPYFPIPLFNTIVTDIDAAHAIFQSKDNSSTTTATQQCLATRLNVATQEMGWYSDIDPGQTKTPLWEMWNTSHQAFLTGNSALSTQLCEGANSL